MIRRVCDEGSEVRAVAKREKGGTAVIMRSIDSRTSQESYEKDKRSRIIKNDNDESYKKRVGNVQGRRRYRKT